MHLNQTLLGNNDDDLPDEGNLAHHIPNFRHNHNTPPQIYNNNNQGMTNNANLLNPTQANGNHDLNTLNNNQLRAYIQNMEREMEARQEVLFRRNVQEGNVVNNPQLQRELDAMSDHSGNGHNYQNHNHNPPHVNPIINNDAQQLQLLQMQRELEMHKEAYARQQERLQNLLAYNNVPNNPANNAVAHNVANNVANNNGVAYRQHDIVSNHSGQRVHSPYQCDNCSMHGMSNMELKPVQVLIQAPKSKAPPMFKKGEDMELYSQRFNIYLDTLNIPHQERRNYFLQNVDNSTYSTISNMKLSPNLPYNDWLQRVIARFGEHIGSLGNSIKLLSISQKPSQSITEYIEDINKVITLSNLNEEESSRLILDKLSNSLHDKGTQDLVIKLRLKHTDNTNVEVLEMVKEKLDFLETQKAISLLSRATQEMPQALTSISVNDSHSDKILQEVNKIAKQNEMMHNMIAQQNGKILDLEEKFINANNYSQACDYKNYSSSGNEQDNHMHRNMEVLTQQMQCMEGIQREVCDLKMQLSQAKYVPSDHTHITSTNNFKKPWTSTTDHTMLLTGILKILIIIPRGL